MIDNCSLNEVSCFACEITLTAVKVLQIDVHHYWEKKSNNPVSTCVNYQPFLFKSINNFTFSSMMQCIRIFRLQIKNSISILIDNPFHIYDIYSKRLDELMLTMKIVLIIFNFNYLFKLVEIHFFILSSHLNKFLIYWRKITRISFYHTIIRERPKLF